MPKRFEHNIAAGIRLLALIAASLCIVANAFGLPMTVRNAAVDALVHYVAEGPLLDRALERLGFAPPAAPAKQILAQMPAIRKIEAAYYAAEEARPNMGGREFLARLRTEIAVDHPAITDEPSLHVLDHVRLPPPPQPFKRKAASLLKPPSPLWEMIMTIATYSQSGLGSQRYLLVKHFQLSDERAYEVLRSSDTFADALQRVYADAGENGDKNLRSLAASIVERHPAAQHEPAVAALYEGRLPPWAAGGAMAGAAAGAFFVDKDGKLSWGRSTTGGTGARPFSEPPPGPYTPPRPPTYRPPPRPIRP